MTSNLGLDPLRLCLRQLRDATRNDVEAVACLRAVEQRRGVIDDLLADLEGQLERTDTAAVITLVGATGAGKSTLLNALVGHDIAAEGVDRPTTTTATIYAPDDADVEGLAAAGGTPGAAARVVRYSPRERGAAAQVFVDAPDMNSVAGDHARRVAALAQCSDVLLVVLHRQSIVETAPVAFIDGFAARRGLAFVLNRADELSDAARAALVRQIEGFARDRWGAVAAPVLSVSALRAKQQPDGSDRQRLWETVHGLVDGQATSRIRRHNAIGTAAMLAEVFREVRAEVAGDLDSVAADVAAGAGEIASAVATASAARWQLSAVTLRHSLWGETARRWDGPGGWALRLGALDVAGAGAAGLLLRRSPLLAAGVAVGSAAAAGVRRVREEQHWSEANPLLPSPDEMAATYRAALAPARVRLGRICSDEAALALPTQEGAAAAVSSAVESSWNTLIQYDLPLAAEKSALRYLRQPLDLPVYALVLWVVYQAALGFVSGEYVGVDFLLNVALLAGVYLGAVRWLVGLGVRRRARRLLDAASVRSRLQLEAWHGAVDSAICERTAALAGALDRLASLDTLWQRRVSGVGSRAGLANGAEISKQAARD